MESASINTASKQLDRESKGTAECERDLSRSPGSQCSAETLSVAELHMDSTLGLVVIPTEISPVLKPLISELYRINNSTENIKFERLEPLLIRLMKCCSKADFTPQVSNYLLSNLDIMHHLSFLAENALQGKRISYEAASCLTLVCECLRMLTDANSLLTVKAAEAGFVVIVLFALEVVANSVQYNKMLHLLLSSLLGFIQNLAVDSACWPHFEATRFVDILAIYSKMQEDDIRFMSIYTLSLLVEVIPLVKQNVLLLEEKVIREYIDILTTAVSSHNLHATRVYGSLVIPADDILRLIKQLWYIEPNRHTIESFLASLIFPIEMCLQRGNKMQQKVAMDLLWTLISDPSLLSQITAGEVRIDFQFLESLVDSSSDASDSIGVMTSCVLYKVHPEFVNELAVLKVIRGAYMFKRYAECIDWCNQVLPPKVEPSSPEKHTALLYRGKALCHLYQQEQKRFEEVSSTLSRKEFHLKQTGVYEKAGGAIRDLGLLFDINRQSFLDDEMSMCLDICMVNVACQVNNLKEYSRCLLCLNRAKLCRSHLCPDSILDAFASGLEKTKNKRVFNLSFFKEGKTTSPHGVNMWLFCGKCESILSRDGEGHFIPKFFKRVYNTESPLQPEHEIRIVYDDWLYRFAIGLLFRGLVNEAFSSFSNSEKVHRTFAQLRRLICFEGNLKDLPDNPTVYLLISPSAPSTSSGFIGHIYHAPFLFALTDKNLETGSDIIPRACQFFLARIGILNFLLLFDDNIRKLLPDEAQIKVCRGDFTVPSEAKRASAIPNGITQILEDLAAATQKNLLESSVATLWGLKLSDATPPPIQHSATYKTYDALSGDMEKLKEALLTSHSLSSPQILNLLPPGYVVEHSNSLVSLPEFHQIIFHGDFEIEMEGSEPFSITLFLVAGNEPSSDIFTLQKPYVIFHRHQPGLEITLGFFINPDTCSALKFLPDPNPKVMLHQIGDQLRISAFTKTLLPELMKLRGLRSYYTVVHRALLQRPTISYDRVCTKRCWYCKLSCNTCLSQASVDMSSKSPGGSTQRFCNETCRNVYFSNTTKEATVLDLFGSPSEHLLLLSFDITLPRSTEGYSRADISVYVSNDTESHVFPKGSLYIVSHHATVVDQHFLEYFIHEDCSFSHMLHYYRSKEYPEMTYSVDFAKHVLTEKLQELGIEGLKLLVDFVSK